MGIFCCLSLVISHSSDQRSFFDAVEEGVDLTEPSHSNFVPGQDDDDDDDDDNDDEDEDDDEEEDSVRSRSAAFRRGID